MKSLYLYYLYYYLVYSYYLYDLYYYIFIFPLLNVEFENTTKSSCKDLLEDLKDKSKNLILTLNYILITKFE